MAQPLVLSLNFVLSLSPKGTDVLYEQFGPVAMSLPLPNRWSYLNTYLWAQREFPVITWQKMICLVSAVSLPSKQYLTQSGLSIYICWMNQHSSKFQASLWLSGKESTFQCRRYRFEPWSGKIPYSVEQLSLGATTTEAPAS